MRLQRPLRCPLVRFVHGHCGLPPPGLALKNPGCAEVDSAGGLAAAVRAHRPAVVRGQVPSDLIGQAGHESDLLPRIREICGQREVTVRLPRGEARSADAGPMFGDPLASSPYENAERCKVADALDSIIKEPTRYLANVSLPNELPELAERMAELQEVIDELTAPRLAAPFGSRVTHSPALYLGSGRQRTPLHFDPTENLTAVLQGTKHFRLYPPSASSQLQPRGGFLAAANCWISRTIPTVYSDLDVFGSEPDAGPKPLDVFLEAGEIIYLPSAWWHAVSGSDEANVTIVFGFEPGMRSARM